jgi:hypothetical protein
MKSTAKYPTIIKTVVAALAAVAAAFVLRALYSAATEDPSAGGMTSRYQDMMLTAREMFVEKADDIQLATMELLKLPSAEIMSDASGAPKILTPDGAEDAAALAGEAGESLLAVFAPYECGGRVYNVEVTGEAVVFYTGYYGSGCVGFLYERELDGVSGYTEMFELSENWKIFYLMSED